MTPASRRTVMSSHPTVRAPRAPMFLRAAVATAALCVLAVAAASTPAAAAEAAPAADETVAELIALNKRALADYTAGRAAAADKTLREALAFAEKNGLADHDMAARTHVHLGIVAIAGLGKREEGLRHFARAQRMRPDIKLTKQLATAALKRDFEDARVVDPD